MILETIFMNTQNKKVSCSLFQFNFIILEHLEPVIAIKYLEYYQGYIQLWNPRYEG